MKTSALTMRAMALVSSFSLVHAQWVQTNGPHSSFVTCLAVRGTIHAGVFRSTDNGTNWNAASKGLTNTDVRALAVSGSNLFAGTRGSGVFRSTDNGTSWTIETTVIGSCLGSLAVSGANLIAGTVVGVWRRPLSEMITSVSTPSAESPTQFSLQQNYPNPFNPSTTIKYELPKSSMVTLSVFDILGREISVLVNERRAAGVHEVKFDGSSLASGVYFYRLQAGGAVLGRSMGVAK